VLLKHCWPHGRRSRSGRGDKSAPEFGVGDASANCPPQIFVIGDDRPPIDRPTNRPSKYAKIRFRPGL